MHSDDWRKLVESFKYPNGEFRTRLDGNMWIITVTVQGVDIFNGTAGPIQHTEVLPAQFVENMDSFTLRGFLRDCLRRLLEHEMDEQLEVGDDRPWYPHGPWSERKWMMRPKIQFESNPMQAELSAAAIRYYRDELQRRTQEASKEILDERTAATQTNSDVAM